MSFSLQVGYRSFISRAENLDLILETNAEFGCHMVTKNEIDANEHIFTTKAFAQIQYLYNTGNGCFCCGNIPNHRINCSRCPTWFCSKICENSFTHKGRCDVRFVKNDCNITRLVTETITVAIKRLGSIDRVVEFFLEVTSSNRKNDDPQYAQIIKLKKRDTISHTKISHRIVDIIVDLYDIQSADLKKHLFSLAMNHANSVEINQFSVKKIAVMEVKLKHSIFMMYIQGSTTHVNQI